MIAEKAVQTSHSFRSELNLYNRLIFLSGVVGDKGVTQTRTILVA